MNYNSLYNKPTLNHKELIGDNKASDIGGMTEEDMQELLETDLTTYYSKDEIDDLFSRSFVYREKSGPIVTFDCPSTSQSIPEVTVGIEPVQSGSGDPSPENIRPIIGVSAVNRYRTGKNLWISGNVSGTESKVVNTLIPAGEYTISFVVTSSDTDSNTSLVTFSFIDNTRLAVRFDRDTRTSSRITLGKTVIKINFYAGYNSSQSSGDTFSYDDIQLEKGDTATTFETFSGTTYTTTLKDANDQPLTCYGGQLENVNGVQTLIVTHANIASYNGETINGPWISSMDVYSEGATPTTGAQVVYPLTTPTEIPQQSQAISTQDGTNNLWADSGEIEVKCLDRIISAGE